MSNSIIRAVQVSTDDDSLEEREGVVSVDGREVARLRYNDLYELAQQARAAISQIDWYHAEYFYANDGGSGASHLVYDDTDDGQGGRVLEELERKRTLCGRTTEQSAEGVAVGTWGLRPVITTDGPDTWGLCKTCYRLYQTKQQLKRRHLAEALGVSEQSLEEGEE